MRVADVSALANERPTEDPKWDFGSSKQEQTLLNFIALNQNSGRVWRPEEEMGAHTDWVEK